MKLPYFTIGHSNRSLDKFVDLLKVAGVSLVADIRAIPRSRANPQFNQDTLPGALAAIGISYEHVAALGGRRGKEKGVLPEVNVFWTKTRVPLYRPAGWSPILRRNDPACRRQPQSPDANPPAVGRVT